MSNSNKSNNPDRFPIFETLGIYSLGGTSSGAPEVELSNELKDPELLDAINSGDMEAKVEFGRRLLEHSTNDKIGSIAHHWLHSLVEFEDSVDAAWMLYDVYQHGLYRFRRDDEKAAYYLRFLVQHQETAAIVQMAVNLAQDGYKQQAHVWFYRAALLNDPTAHIAYALGLYEGQPEGNITWNESAMKEILNEFILDMAGMSAINNQKWRARGEAELREVARKYAGTVWSKKAEDLIYRISREDLLVDILLPFLTIIL